jgi:hypothetical protein
MRVKFCCDNGANIHSVRKDTFDTERDFGITDEEWQEMSEEEKYKMVEEWANERINIWFEEE